MPRLTSELYLATHTFLWKIWLHREGLYVELSPEEQRHLHDYFRPSEDLSGTELLAHRQDISTQRPSLPHCAGRALAKMEKHVSAYLNAASTGELVRAVDRLPTKRVTSVRVRAVVRPQPDLTKLARALLSLPGEPHKALLEGRARDSQRKTSFRV